MKFAYDFRRFYLRSHFLFWLFLNWNLLLFNKFDIIIIIVKRLSLMVTLAIWKVILFAERYWSDFLAAAIAYLYFYVVFVHYYVLVLKNSVVLNRKEFAIVLRIIIHLVFIIKIVAAKLKWIVVIYFFVFWKVYLFDIWVGLHFNI